MYKRQRGIMLITTLLISALILIFFMSIISLTNQSQRNLKLAIENEKALLAARAAYQEALFAMHANLPEAIKHQREQGIKTPPSSSDSIIGAKNWTVLKKGTLDANLNSAMADANEALLPPGSPDVEYGYAYACNPPYYVGSIIAGGRLTTARGRIVKYVVSSEITIYQGIIAKNLITDKAFSSFSTSKLPKSSIRAILSADTSLPIAPWLGLWDMKEEHQQDRTSLKAIENMDAPKALLEYRNPKDYILNPLSSLKNDDKFPDDSFMRFDQSLEFLRSLELEYSARTLDPEASPGSYRDVKPNIDFKGHLSWKKVTAYQVLALYQRPTLPIPPTPPTPPTPPIPSKYVLQKTYGSEPGQRYPYFSDLFLDYDVERLQNSPYTLKPGTIDNFECFSEYIPDNPAETNPNADNIITGQNFWLIPLGFSSKKLIAPVTEDLTRGFTETPRNAGFIYGTPEKPDLVLNDALLIVTGNLDVRGNIRGRGILIVLGNLTFKPNSLSASGDALIVHATGKIFGRGGAKDGDITTKTILAQMPSYFPVRLKAFMLLPDGSFPDDRRTGISRDFASWTMKDFKDSVTAYYRTYVNKNNPNQWDERYWNKELDNWYKSNI